MKSNKDKTIRVTEHEKLLIDTSRKMQKSNFADHVIYRKSSLSKYGIVYSYKIAFLLEQINSDELLEACYSIAIENLGNEGFYKKFAFYTNSLSITGFETPLSKEEQKLRKESSGNKSFIKKDYIECIVCLNEEECIKDLKTYLIANYKEDALELIEKNNKLKDKCYIDIHIKRHQIPIYLSCAKIARDIAEDSMCRDILSSDEDELLEYKAECKFYDELIETLEEKKDDFILKMHAVLLPNLFLSIIEGQINIAENNVMGRRFSLFDDCFIDLIGDNKSANQLKKEGIITLKIYDYLKAIIAENKEVCNYFARDYSNIQKYSPFFKVDDKIRKRNFKNIKIQTKGE